MNAISDLRKKTYTQCQAQHPVLMTLKYDIEQVKLLIQLAIDADIRICTRVDIITPNGLPLSEDFTLSPEQIKKVWQKRPEVIQLHLKPPKNLIGHLPEVFITDVGIDGLLIDQINADYYLTLMQRKTDSENTNPDKNPGFHQDAIAYAVFTRILPKILPDPSKVFLNNMKWECFLQLEEALILDGAKNINIDKQPNKDNSTVTGIDSYQGEINTSYKAFRERLKNLVKIYKSPS